MATMAIHTGQMYLLQKVMSPQADREIKRFKNVAYEKIVGPQPSTWQETLMDVVTIGSCVGLTVLTFFVTNKIENRWKARVMALAAAASAARMKKAADAVQDAREAAGEHVGGEEEENIDRAAALVRSLPNSVNLGERVDLHTAEELIARGETILRIGPVLCYKNTPDDVLTRLTTNQLVRIINPRGEGAPAPKPTPAAPPKAPPRLPGAESEMKRWDCARIINELLTHKWGEILKDINPIRDILPQVPNAQPGEVYVRILGRAKAVFKNVPQEIIQQLQGNEAVTIIRIPDAPAA
jgi:hypothetical protein